MRYFAHISYEIPEKEIIFGFENGVVGLDMNYNFVSLCTADKEGNFKSYHEVKFRNLHSYRKNKRADYISHKIDKVVNYCINKKKGLVIEDLSFNQEFSYEKKRNRKLSNFKTTALDLLERKCLKRGVAVRKVHLAYTSLIGKYKYSRSRNLSNHILASYVIARKSLGFKEEIPANYKWLLAQVRDVIKPRLKPSSPYYNWAKLHDFFKYSGITSFKTSEVMKKVLQMKHVLNPVTGVQPDNLKASLSSTGKIDDWNKFWNFIENTNFL
ncbi:MAG: IS200/IS605 family accessory protein TnpB-related protein [Patescibacteria group bacterium]|nr:IS200/IS605 family accessory protein TnpB-related protein [Patescibacteria group bacterium]